MIKEIAKEFDRKNRENVYNLLNKIKDLEYENKSLTFPYLEHINEEKRIKITISFNINHRINEINIYDTSIGWTGQNIVHIVTGLNSKGVTAISEELYKKYFENRKGVK